MTKRITAAYSFFKSGSVDIAQGIGQAFGALPLVLSQVFITEPRTAFGTFLVQVVLGVYLFVACGTLFNRHWISLSVSGKKNRTTAIPRHAVRVRVSLGLPRAEDEMGAFVTIAKGSITRIGPDCYLFPSGKSLRGLYQPLEGVPGQNLFERFRFLYITYPAILE